MNLSKKLASWQKADLITARQMQDIKDYEAQNTKPYTFYGLVVLSLFCIGLGIIAVIAANWYAIPPSVKLGLDFTVLAICGVGIYEAFIKSKINRFNGLVFLFAILIMATIGLIAQIYQLQPDGAAAYLLWAILVFPLLFFVRSSLLPLLWVPIAWYSFWSYVIEHKIGHDILQTMTQSWLYSIPLIWLFSWGIFYQILGQNTRQNAQGFRKALAVWLVFFMGFVIYVMDKGYGYSVFYNITGEAAEYNSKVLAGSISASIILTGISLYLSFQKGKNFLLPYIMALMIIGALVHMHFVLSLLALFGAGVYAYKSGSRRLLNFVLVLAGIRIFVIYLDLMGSLMDTGLGLIGSGIALLLIIWAWLKVAAVFKRRIGNEK